MQDVTQQIYKDQSLVNVEKKVQRFVWLLEHVYSKKMNKSVPQSANKYLLQSRFLVNPLFNQF